MIEIMLAPRQRPSIPPMLAIKLLLKGKQFFINPCDHHNNPLPCDVSVLDDQLAVGLLDEDVDHSRVLPHVEEDGLLEPVDPLLVLPEPGLGPGVALAAPGLCHGPHLATQVRVSLLQGLFQ